MALFDDPLTEDVTITNNTAIWQGVVNRALEPSEVKTLTQLGVDYCTFKRRYLDLTDPLRQKFEGTNPELSATAVIGTTGIICPGEAATSGSMSGLTPSTTPPTSPGNGDPWIRLPDGILFTWDSTRNKWLSAAEQNIAVGRDFNNVTNQALDYANGIGTNQVPIQFTRTMVLVRVELATDSASTWTFQIRDVSGAPSVIYSLNATGTIALDVSANVDILSPIDMFASGTGIDTPRVDLYFRERGA